MNRDCAVCLSGAPLGGMLPFSGIGERIEVAECEDMLESSSTIRDVNCVLIKSLRAGAHAKALLDATLADAALGRMTEPMKISENDAPDSVRLVPRFSVVQHREDGTMKVRPCDNFSWSHNDILL